MAQCRGVDAPLKVPSSPAVASIWTSCASACQRLRLLARLLRQIGNLVAGLGTSSEEHQDKQGCDRPFHMSLPMPFFAVKSRGQPCTSKLSIFKVNGDDRSVYTLGFILDMYPGHCGGKSSSLLYSALPENGSFETCER